MRMDAFLMSRRAMLTADGVVFALPGLMISVKGLRAYAALWPLGSRWWLLLITAVVLAGFLLMFRKIVGRYAGRVAALPAERNVWHKMFPPRGWVLIVFMMCLGMVLKLFAIPTEFYASFYCGLGPALIVAGVWFLTNVRIFASR